MLYSPLPLLILHPSFITNFSTTKYRSLNSVYEQLDQMEAHFVDLDHEAYIQDEDIPILSDDTNLFWIGFYKIEKGYGGGNESFN